MRILISDDDAVCCQTLAARLRPWGPADTALTGEDTVRAWVAALLAGRPYGLAFLDIGMPDIDGHGLLCALRGTETAFVEHRRASGPPLRHTPIIMATSRERLQDVATAFRNQCDGYLVKPVEDGPLAELLAKLNLPPG
jgi:two-component system chemotaxis response regulator CheY